MGMMQEKQSALVPMGNCWLIREIEIPTQLQVSLSHALAEVPSFKCLHIDHTQGTENQHLHYLSTRLWLSQMLRKLTTTE